MKETELVPTLFDFLLSEEVDLNNTISAESAAALHQYFKDSPLFSWQENHNGCEARADAVCLLLERWQIPNYKAWVFSGRFLKKHIGALRGNWKYHVAAMVPVLEDGSVVQYVIDPATSAGLQTLYEWAANVTEYPHSYHFVRHSQWYIFHDQKIKAANWHARNRRNRKWMIQGLANVNGLHAAGKAALIFNRGRIRNKAKAFEKLLQHPRQM